MSAVKQERVLRAERLRLKKLREDAAKGIRQGKVVVEAAQLMEFLATYDRAIGALREIVEASVPLKVRPGESRLDASIRWHNRRNAAFDEARAVIAEAEAQS